MIVSYKLLIDCQEYFQWVTENAYVMLRCSTKYNEVGPISPADL